MHRATPQPRNVATTCCRVASAVVDQPAATILIGTSTAVWNRLCEMFFFVCLVT